MIRYGLRTAEGYLKKNLNSKRMNPTSAYNCTLFGTEKEAKNACENNYRWYKNIEIVSFKVEEI